MSKVMDLKSMNDVIEYYSDCLLALKDTDDSVVAGWMVGIVSNDNFDDWYHGAGADPLFIDLFEYLAQLELPDGPDYYREAQWGMVRALVRLLDEKYS